MDDECKICRECKVSKPINKFNPSHTRLLATGVIKQYRRSICRVCVAKVRKYKKNNHPKYTLSVWKNLCQEKRFIKWQAISSERAKRAAKRAAKQIPAEIQELPLPYAMLGEEPVQIEFRNPNEEFTPDNKWQPKDVWALPDIKTLLPAVPPIDPVSYYITSGEAVLKTEKLIRDCQTAIEASEPHVIIALKELLGKVQALYVKLLIARGTHKWLEVSRNKENILRVRAVDPKNKSPYERLSLYNKHKWWEEKLQELSRSNQTGAEFAKSLGVSPISVSKWRKIIKREQEVANDS